MSARPAMRYRATIERDVNLDQGATNDWGDAGEPDWRTHIEGLPCMAWFTAGRETQDTRIAVTEDRRMIVPLGSDVTENDRVAKITDRRGVETIFEGEAAIEHVGRRRDHIEIMLEGS